MFDKAGVGGKNGYVRNDIVMNQTNINYAVHHGNSKLFRRLRESDTICGAQCEIID